ncbi:histidine kinase [Fulvivirga sediminis]|uniref:Histidine kinase n=1 Tax=Fulvivirga sediminis TaxID=2803949 RepID=A0A937JXI3_9BACT|nr:sensor histidine kinase [Fulvivirga sediminis]MBL3655508.1 histidine kinase [Fulvivirga sediminis]
MKKLFIHKALFRILIPPFYGIVVYLMILLINNNVSQISEIFTGQEVYVCIGLTYILSETLRLTVLILNRFHSPEIDSKRIWTQTLLGIVASIIVISISISAYFEFIIKFSIAETQLIIFNCIYAATSLIYNLLFFSNDFLHRQNQNKIKEEQLLTETIEAELSKFQNEVNPDLLYDSLETLITLVHKNADEAEDYIDRLSLVYRYILGYRKKELSTLNEELRAANNIVHLLNFKYNNCITFRSHISASSGAMPMVPGVLPGLVETIIRNSLINAFKPLFIELETEHADGYFILQHKLNEKLLITSTHKSIFKQVQNAYGFYSEKPVVQVKAYDMNYIKIPILEILDEKKQSEYESIDY